MDYKIIHIIPAPKNMFSVYRDICEIEDIKNKIVCLALLEYDDGEREIVPYDISDGDGIIDRLASNLQCIEFS